MIDRPELFFALAGPLGTRLTYLSDRLANDLRSFGYDPVPISISSLLKGFSDYKEQGGTSAYDRVHHLQGIANNVRRRIGDGAALARAAIIEIRKIRSARSGHPDKAAVGTAFIMDQLKHPEEARLLRQTYGDAFHLVGGHASWDKRVEEFSRMIADSVNKPGQHRLYVGDATKLITTDDRGADDFGQNMRDLYPQADVFINLNPTYGESSISRFVDLLFGHPFHTPTPEEYSMYVASAVSLRSSDNSRQVGAAIVKLATNPDGGVSNADVLAVGMNEVPRAGGGFYWDQSSPDCRDQALQEDRAAKIKASILTELVERLRQQSLLGPNDGNREDSQVAEDWLGALKGTQFLNIGEFSRPVHAEMAAIIDAARRGVSIDGSSIYVTTFPCHNCAKHLVAAGLRRVVYLEPYPKSRAEDLYREEVYLDSPDGKAIDGKVVFSAYSGVAPRQYSKLFSMSQRGGKLGLNQKKWHGAKLRLQPTYVADHLHDGHVRAERTALEKFKAIGYDWDFGEICP